MNYTPLKVEKVEDGLPIVPVGVAADDFFISRNFGNKGKWRTCLALALAASTIIASAVTIGIVVGYTYCYLEHRIGMTWGNITQATNVRILTHRAALESATDKPDTNKTINGALMSSVIIARILNLGGALLAIDDIPETDPIYY